MLYTKENTGIENAYRVWKNLDYYGCCWFCGDTFRSRSPLARYCSTRCANDASIQRRRERAARKRVLHMRCPICDTEITQGGGKVRLYCGAACKQAAYRQRKRKPDNLVPFVRAELALKLKPVIEAKSERRMKAGNPALKSEEGQTSEHIGKIAGVGKNTVEKVEEILASGQPGGPPGSTTARNFV